MSTDAGHDPKKPCRACTDFKDWSKTQKENLGTSDGLSEEQQRANLQCPLDRQELGRSTWGFLHSMAAYYPDKPCVEEMKNMQKFFKLFAHFYPCEICAADLQEQLERFPPKTQSQHELSQWLCRVHNRINLRLGKPQFDCKKVNERWRDGWKDGSCD